jgi:predicted lipoprotein with Yx(FWY)xxD motif
MKKVAADASRFLHAVSLAAAVVGCSVAQADPPPDPATPAGIQVIREGHGWTYADSEGMTLYTYGNDQKKPGGSLCNGSCAELWPPLLAGKDDRATGAWGFAVRDDGQRQWALNDQPVYRYRADPEPGARFGHNYDRLWSTAELLIPTPPQFSITRTVLGRTLATRDGKTLYRMLDNTAGACEGDCLQTWSPHAAPLSAITPWDEWSVVERGDGTLQWAYQGDPLFTFAGDVNPREVFGRDYAPETWQTVVLEPRPPEPDWVSTVGTDGGEMLGNAEGKVIYYNVLKPGQADCVGHTRTCRSPDLQPIKADADAKAVGDWTILTRPDGTRVWAFKGHILYTSTLDKYPGEFRGIVFGGYRGMKVIMRSGDRLQGLAGAGT